MKKIYALTFALGILSTAIAQWEQITSYPEYYGAVALVELNGTIFSTDNGNVYVEGGLFKSEDGGETWDDLSLNCPVILSKLASLNGNLYGGTWGHGIYKSEDMGQTWNAINNGLPEGFASLDLFVGENGIYICGDGIFYSDNEGSSWTDISIDSDHQAFSIVEAENTLIASSNADTGQGIYKSTDNGSTWLKVDASSGISDTWIERFYYFNNIVYAAVLGDMGSGLIYASSDLGETWISGNGTEDQGHNYPNSFIGFENAVFVSTSNGVYTSKDNGANWSNLDRGSVSLAVINNYLLAGTGADGIWKHSLQDIFVSLDSSNKIENFSVHPNPAKNNLKISCVSMNLESTDFSIYNIAGKSIFHGVLSKAQKQIDISNLNSGVYFIKINSGYEVYSMKFIKE